MAELLRCRPCGFVIREDKLGDVCPACGLPRKVFEPYRERVSKNRLLILGFDIHPIAIHLSQTFVALIPILIIFNKLFPNIQPEMLQSVIYFSILMLPFSLILAAITGIIDGLTRFKTLKTPLLRVKIITSIVSLIVSFILFFTTKPNEFGIRTFILSLISLLCAILLGFWGKKLIDVILPGTYPMKRGSKNASE